MLQTFEITAGGRVVNAAARFFRYESVNSAGGNELMKIRADGNDLGTYMPGDSITLPFDATTWEITPMSQTATATVRLGIGGVESSRIFGIVQVVDSKKATTQAAQSFVGSITATGGAGQFGTVQIFNPPGSGKRVIVEALGLSSAASNGYCVGFSNATLGTLISGLNNKLSGGAGSAAQWYQKTDNATDPVGLVTALLYSGGVGATGVVSVVPQRPLIVMPGFGLLIGCRVAAGAITATPDFYEEAL